MLAQVTHTVENIDPSLKPQAELLRTALDDITAMTGALTGYLMSAAQHSSDIYKVGLGSVRYLLAVGDLLIGWRLLVLAGVAHAALADGPSQNDEAFYRGKIAVAAFFCEEHAAETDRGAQCHRKHRRRHHARARRRLLRRVSLAPPAERELTAVFCRILRPQFTFGDAPVQTVKPSARNCSRPSSVILSGPHGGFHTQLMRMSSTRPLPTSALRD